eukprot:2741561-Rhodomonas_salina.2
MHWCCSAEQMFHGAAGLVRRHRILSDGRCKQGEGRENAESGEMASTMGVYRGKTVVVLSEYQSEKR